MFKIKAASKFILLLIILSFFSTKSYPFYQYEIILAFILFVLILFVSLKTDDFLGVSISILGVALFNPIIKAEFVWSTWLIIFDILIPVLIIWLTIDIILYLKDKRKGFGDLTNITQKSKTGLYIVTDSGYKYEMDASLYNDLKIYMRQNQIAIVSHWYAQLTEVDQQRIKVSSEFE